MLVTPTNPASTERSKPPILTIVIAAVVLVAIAISIWMVLNNPAKPTGLIELNAPAKMNAEEQAYAKTMRIENIALSRAENFIHQEVTILKADIVNDGPQTVQKLFVTVEFFDDMRQIVLRETRPALGTPPSPLAGGQRRGLEISFDRVPASWNMQQPTVRINALQLAAQ
jgi:hypothetical protein